MNFFDFLKKRNKTDVASVVKSIEHCVEKLNQADSVENKMEFAKQYFAEVEKSSKYYAYKKLISPDVAFKISLFEVPNQPPISMCGIDFQIKYFLFLIAQSDVGLYKEIKNHYKEVTLKETRALELSSILKMAFALFIFFAIGFVVFPILLLLLITCVALWLSFLQRPSIIDKNFDEFKDLIQDSDTRKILFSPRKWIEKFTFVDDEIVYIEENMISIIVLNQGKNSSVRIVNFHRTKDLNQIEIKNSTIVAQAVSFLLNKYLINRIISNWDKLA